MDEETTTPVPEEAGVEQTQPVETEVTAAVETTDADTEQKTEEAPESASTDDAELTDWAATKGLELDSDNARKLAKMARESEKAFHAKSQRASELEKAVTTNSEADTQAIEEYAANTSQDPEVLKVVRELQTKQAVRDFWDTPGIDRKFEPAMVETLGIRPDLKNDLESLYAVTVVRTGGVATARSQGKREALESLAHKQQAAVPTGNATTSGAPKEKPFADLSIEEMEKRLKFVRR